MEKRNSSPRIQSVSWGSIIVENGRSFRDAKLFPGGGREWSWNETGTDHTPGIQPADVEELLDNGASVVVLSEGFDGRLKVTSEALQMLKDRGVEVYVRQTEAAVKLYNELRDTQTVGGLFHTTC